MKMIQSPTTGSEKKKGNWNEVRDNFWLDQLKYNVDQNNMGMKIN